MYILILLASLALASCTEYVYDQDTLDYNDQDSAMGSGSNELISDNTKQPKLIKKTTVSATEMTSNETDSVEVTEVRVSTTRTRTTTTQVPNTKTKPAPSPTFRASGYEQTELHTDGSEEENDDTLTSYPFSVSLQRKGAHYATGALLDKRWILTVAGEFFNVRESIKLFRARLGSVDCKRGGTLIALKRLEIHPSYKFGQPNFDLALLRMAQPVDYTDFIRPISLSNNEKKVRNAKFMTTYWPRLIVRGKVLPTTAKERVKQNSMRVSTQRLIPSAKCRHLNNMENVTLEESTLCLKPVVSHHSQCLPDAGAPVVAEDGLWGITSGWISVNCASFPSPTVFSRMSSPSVRSWLDSQLLSL